MQNIPKWNFLTPWGWGLTWIWISKKRYKRFDWKSLVGTTKTKLEMLHYSHVNSHLMYMLLVYRPASVGRLNELYIVQKKLLIIQENPMKSLQKKSTKFTNFITIFHRSQGNFLGISQHILVVPSIDLQNPVEIPRKIS